ncbi:hypothetical protein ACFLQI_03050 [Candidatus Undinarchaeota archaeon]
MQDLKMAKIMELTKTNLLIALIILTMVFAGLLPNVEMASPTGFAPAPGPEIALVMLLESCNFTSDCGTNEVCRYDILGSQLCVNDTYTCPRVRSAHIKLIMPAEGVFPRDYADSSMGSADFRCNNGWWSEDPITTANLTNENYSVTNETYSEMIFNESGSTSITSLKLPVSLTNLYAELRLYGFPVSFESDAGLEEDSYGLYNGLQNKVPVKSVVKDIGGSTKIFTAGYGTNILNESSLNDTLVAVFNYTESGGINLENYTAMDFNRSDDYAQAVSVLEINGKTNVFVTGYGTWNATQKEDIFIAAYNYTGGKLYLENLIYEDYEQSTDKGYDIHAMYVDGQPKVVVAGLVNDTESGNGILLSVYDYSSGSFQQEDADYFGFIADNGLAITTSIEEGNTKIFLGANTNDWTSDTMIIVYNYTNNLLYNEYHEYFDIADCEEIYDIAAHRVDGNTRLFLSGFASTGIGGANESLLLVLNYTADAISELTYEAVDFGSTLDAFYSVSAVDFNRNTKVFVAGYASDTQLSEGNSYAILSVYNYTDDDGLQEENYTIKDISDQDDMFFSVNLAEFDNNLKAFTVGHVLLNNTTTSNLTVSVYNYTKLPEKYPTDIQIDVGANGTVDYTYEGELSYAVVPPYVDITDALNQAITSQNISINSSYTNPIPLNVTVGSAGRLVISGLSISYYLVPCAQRSDCNWGYCVHGTCSGRNYIYDDGYCDPGENYNTESACDAPESTNVLQIIQGISNKDEPEIETASESNVPIIWTSKKLIDKGVKISNFRMLAPPVDGLMAGPIDSLAAEPAEGLLRGSAENQIMAEGRLGGVAATVVDDKGAPLENVEVSLVTTTGAVTTAHTNNQGVATIYHYAGDPLQIMIELDGMELANKKVQIEDDLTVDMQEIQAAEMGRSMSTWAILLVIVLIIPAVAFYLFSAKK